MAELAPANAVGVLGGNSLVGSCLLDLLQDGHWQVTMLGRITGLALAQALARAHSGSDPVVALWISVAPIWVLPAYFDLLQARGARRVVLLSSTSRFTKGDSSDMQEQQMASGLAAAEAQVQAWAGRCGIEWVILRPTLIYGLGRDKNIAEIARFIQRFGVFPLFGPALGLRQPVHAQDLARACLAALQTRAAANQAYNISGGETLSYRDMVARVFLGLGAPVRMLPVPRWTFRLALSVLRRLPRYRDWSVAMAERMNRDLVFDHLSATRDLGFAPRPFLIGPGDLPAPR